MTEANVRRLHNPLYNETKYPPMPPRIRLAAECWERVWWLTFVSPVTDVSGIDSIVERFETDTVKLRAQMRTQRRLCITVKSTGLDEQSEFEIAMMVMSMLQREFGSIERVEDRLASVWPIDDF